ncbi:hypothetical protein [Comamonas sp. CMM02]|jgi:hypothetical protein|uniref:hypothetical protein n=1 Tax=Comamonas sp. CMM02 TaxID=2769307 RepID=UPI00178087F8|nr:hypothetical protein [Comamonas sp. CMM02]MBD9402661.1 hypothetical protein [Comamonas sp. CMM02]
MKTEFRTTSVPLRSDDTNLMIAAIQIGLRRDCLLHPRNLSLRIGRSSNQDDCYQAESCLRLADVTGSTLHIRHCRLKLERQQRVDLRQSQVSQKQPMVAKASGHSGQKYAVSHQEARPD